MESQTMMQASNADNEIHADTRNSAMPHIHAKPHDNTAAPRVNTMS